MVTAVRQGERIGWGGEGRLSGRDGIGPLKVGASLIAIRAQAPVIPVVIHGGHDAMPFSRRTQPIESTALIQYMTQSYLRRRG